MAADLPIPIFTNLNELYQNLGTTFNHAERWNNLAEEFQSRFGKKPAFIARAPGRVNLIGEHIDYALFGCFPAAIERDILIACAPRSVPASATPSTEPHHAHGSVVAENLYPKYTRQVFHPARKLSVSGTSGAKDVPEEAVHVEEWHMDIDTKQLKWESYVKAGYYGVLNHYFAPETRTSPVPVDLLVTGSVPAGSGLSSSAAMVVASTLAFLAVNNKLDAVTKGKLVEMSMENEKRVGVNSGGMDQAASVISTTNNAIYISFFPRLSAQLTPLPGSADVQVQVDSASLPPRAVFVCANSLVVSDKVVHAKTRYNLRVVETLVGARVLGRRLGLEIDAKEKITLREVLGRLSGEDPAKGEDMDLGKLTEALKRMIKDVEALKPTGGGDEEGVTLEEMIEWSGLSEADFKETYLSWVDVEATHFQLYKRAKHVFTEALRVLQFREVCLRANASPSASVLEELGALMNESQDSCASVFECSCPELDELIRISREAGAYGSRLTGAGWGGCTVSLVAESEVESFIAKVASAYGPYKGLEGEKLHEAIFATKPSSGACVYKFD